MVESADTLGLKPGPNTGVQVQFLSGLLMDKLFERRKTTLDAVRNLIYSSYSKAEVLKKLDLGLGGGNYRWLNIVINRYDISTKHFTGQGHLKGKTHSWIPKRPLNQVLVENSLVASSHRLKIRLYKEGMLDEQCCMCGLFSTWNGKRLSLHLDHTDGNPANNKIDNLRILCPNCHSQTKTYGSKNRLK